MDLKFIKTKKGGVMSIHSGKVMTTNIFESLGWVEIVKDDAKAVFRRAMMSFRYSCNEREENEAFSRLVKDLSELYSNLSDFTKPYRRVKSSSKSSSLSEHYSTIEGKSDGITYDGIIDLSTDSSEGIETQTTPEIKIEDLRKDCCSKIIKFFSEFTFVPATRFINTLSKFETQKEAKTYINNYMSLTDHPDKNEIAEKIKSTEFNDILKELFECRGDKEINKRLEIYYGPAGTGKTTEAINLYPDANITVCNELMDSDSIMKVFDFNDENGNPVFKPSQLQLDMINGKPHILDEMNLLPLNTLRFLQGILDSKEKINYEGKEIVIKEGFKIIGTMNLVVNGQVFSLPEPIVDRAQKLKEYTANEDLLANFAF